MFKITKSSGRCLEKVIKLQNIRSNCQLLNPTQSRSLYVVTYAINNKLNVDKSIISNLSLLPSTNVREFHTSLSLGQDSQVINCPAFADSISEGDIKWNKAVGDSVNADDVVAEIETDKTSIQVPAPASGVIEELIAPEGSTVKPGMPLFKMKAGAGGGGGSAAPAPKPAAAAPPSPPPPPKAAPAPAAAPPPPPPQQQQAPPPPPPPRASPPPSQPPPAPTPAAKPMAAQRPPVQVPPAASVRVPPADPTKEITGTRTEQRVKMSRMRMRISQRLKDAQNINAMLTTFNEIDMTNIMQMRKEHGEMFLKKHNIKLGFMSAFVKGAAYALQEIPTVNAVIDPSGQEIIYRDYIDISVAVASPKGLVVPVLRSVERMGYSDIEKALAAVAEKARTGALAIEDMDGGTFTISNGGVFGSLFGTPIINPPQSAILGMHAINEKPVAIKGQVVIRPIMVVALTYDHRLIDGREAVTFLKTIKNSVEDPRSFLLGL